ncbi:MAG: hypothetical protein ACYCW6_02490 [Candidatus Xenobia bacterium]
MRRLGVLLLLTAAAFADTVHSKGVPQFSLAVPAHWQAAVKTSQKGHPMISVSPQGKVDRNLDVIGIHSAGGGALAAVQQVVAGEGRKYHGHTRAITYGTWQGYLTEWDFVTPEKTHLTEYFCAFAPDDRTMMQGDGAFLPAVQQAAEANFATVLASVQLSGHTTPTPTPSPGHHLLSHLKGLKQFLFHGTHKVLQKLIR